MKNIPECGKGAGFSDEIETNVRQAISFLHRRGKGAGFSDEIETWLPVRYPDHGGSVVRARGSQMRLKLCCTQIYCWECKVVRARGSQMRLKPAWLPCPTRGP